MDGDFNEAYYSTAAQVIPVFFLAIVGTGIAFRERVLENPVVALLLIAMTGMVAVGEATALAALAGQEEPTFIADVAIYLAVWLPLLAIVMALLQIAWGALFSHLAWWVKIAAEALIVLAAGTMTASLYAGADQATVVNVMVAVLTGAFFLAFAAASVVEIIQAAKRVRKVRKERKD
jgi:hypothetical protein